MLVRLTHAYGNDTETIVTTSHHPDLTAEDLARALLAGLDGVARVRVWEEGASFLDEPSADVTEAIGGPATLTPELLDVATMVKLAMPRQVEVPTEPIPVRDGPPPWLASRGLQRPYEGPGRPPASGRVPPV